MLLIAEEQLPFLWEVGFLLCLAWVQADILNNPIQKQIADDASQSKRADGNALKA